MTQVLLRNTARFVLLVLLQILIFDRLAISSIYIPQVYLLFIILLPFETPKWLLLLLSFALGLCIDLFSYTVGLHTAACTLIGFLVPWVQTLVTSRQSYEPGVQPGIRGLGFRWFLGYTLLLVSFHHLMIYYLDAFKLSGFFMTFFHAALNIMITTAVIICLQLLTTRSQKSRER